MGLRLDAFTDYRFLSAPTYSPSGDVCAFLMHGADTNTNDYHHTLWTYSTATGQSSQVGTRDDIPAFLWQEEGKLLYAICTQSKAVTGEEKTAVYVYDMASKQEKCLFTVPLKATVLGRVGEAYILRAAVHVPRSQLLEGTQGDERAALIASFKEEDTCCTVFDEYPFWYNGRGVINKIRRTLLLYHPATDTLTPVTEPLFDVETVCVKQTEGIILFVGHAFDCVCKYRQGLYLYDVKTRSTRCLVPDDVYEITHLEMIGGLVVFCGNDFLQYSVSQCPQLYTVDPATCVIQSLCAAELSVGNPVGSDCRYGSGTDFKADAGKLYFISGVADASHLMCCTMDGVLSTCIQLDGSIDSFDIHQGQAFLVSMRHMRLQELYAGDTATGSMRRLSAFNDAQFTQNPPVVPERLFFRDADGFEIHGFVLKPKDFDPAKTYPGILDIHGGPHLSYGEVYYHEMQYWASQGNFVFYCNPRGGDGRGNAFGALCGHFGTFDYTDIMDFTDRVLQKYPQLDAKRLGVTGGSYGGFMTNWIVGHTSRFAAAVSQRSIANFVSMEGTSDIGVLFAKAQILASTHTDIEKMWEQSPLKYADRVTTPTLFIHAELDYRCWMVEALQMYTALRCNGVHTRLCLFKDENHELSRSGKPKSRIRRLQEITDWMNQFLQIV